MAMMFGSPKKRKGNPGSKRKGKRKGRRKKLSVSNSGHRSVYSDYYKKKRRKKARASGPGWRVDGTDVYRVKGKTPSRRKTYKTKRAAQTAARRR